MATKKATAAKTVAAKTTAAAPAAEKKAPARKTTKTTVTFEMGELSVTAADVQKAVKADVKAKGLEAAELNIYINTAEKVAYYTVNGEANDDYKVVLA